MSGYYAERLSGRRLERCYEIAPPRVQQYLEAEIRHVIGRLHPGDLVLELGCGCGRVAIRMSRPSRLVIGIDTAAPSVKLAAERAGPASRCRFLVMDARALGFPDGCFDAVVCVQNGICAFGIEPATLLDEALRVTKAGGIVLLSTYSDSFWDHRLGWFQAQAAEGLLGPLDLGSCVDGTIVCEDGFRSGRLSPAQLRELASGLDHEISEVDGSSLFLEVRR